MLVSLKWLREYVDIPDDVDVDDLAQRLTMASAEVERVHRIGQGLPVTAWRIIAAGTLDARISELIDAKAGLAARALDGVHLDESEEGSVQLSALVTMLRDAVSEL